MQTLSVTVLQLLQPLEKADIKIYRVIFILFSTQQYCIVARSI